MQPVAGRSRPPSIRAGSAYFAQLGEQGLSPTQLGRGPAWRRDAEPALPGERTDRRAHRPAPPAPRLRRARPPSRDACAGAPTPKRAKHSIHAVQMIRAYRMIGHLEADLDPLGHHAAQPAAARWIPRLYGFDGAAMDLPIYHRRHAGLRNRHAAPECWRSCARTYCGRIGYEFMHINDAEQKDWLQRRIEGPTRRSTSRPKARRRSSTS